jgi:hypothetical protein
MPSLLSEFIFNFCKYEIFKIFGIIH